jgi:hypothetical protein
MVSVGLRHPLRTSWLHKASVAGFLYRKAFHSLREIFIDGRTSSCLSGSVAKFDFWGKIQKLSIRNSMTYRLPKSRKSNFATEPKKGDNRKKSSGSLHFRRASCRVRLVVDVPFTVAEEKWPCSLVLTPCSILAEQMCPVAVGMRANPGGAARARASHVTDVSRGGVRRHGKDCGGDNTACEGRARHYQRAMT